MAITENSRAPQIAEMMRLNPDTFPTEQAAIDWGKRYYGWTDTAGTNATAGTTARPTDPFTAMGGGVWIGTQWVPKDHPLAIQFQNQQQSSEQQQASTGQLAKSATPLTAPTTQLKTPITQAPAFQAPTYQSIGQAPVYTEQAPFVAPTGTTFTQDPGYQVRLAEGVKALDYGASARGTLRGGAQQKALMRFGQDLGSQEYGAAYNRALTEYGLSTDEARYGYQSLLGAYDRDAGDRRYGHESAFRGAEAEYDPTMQTWQARQAAAAADAQANFTRDFDLYRYQTDENYRRWADLMNDQYRNRALTADIDYRDRALAQEQSQFSTSDAFRRYQLEEQRRQFLATLGNF